MFKLKLPGSANTFYFTCGLATAIFVVIPSIIVKKVHEGNMEIVMAMTMTYLVAIGTLSISRTRMKKLLAILISSYYTMIYFMMIVFVQTDSLFDARFLTHAPGEIIPTAIGIYGPVKITVTTMIFGLFCYLSYILVNEVSKIRLSGNRRAHCSIIAAATILFVHLTPQAHSYFMANERQELQDGFFENPVVHPAAVTADSSRDDNFVILQLESLNGLAANGYMTLNGVKYDGEYMPNLLKYAEQGIYYPLFWANSILTIRAQESILCGIIGNIDDPYANRTNIDPERCLPHILRKKGYQTVYMPAFDLDFANTGLFLSETGFSDTPDVYEFMQKDDHKFEFGYEDCTYYKRAMGYVKNKYADPKKLFAYFAVSGHHHPFRQALWFNDNRPFKRHKLHIERYLNSVHYQDKCLSEFMDEFESYAPENTHLIILGDHSIPVEQHGSQHVHVGSNTENFLSSFLYIPAKKDRMKYATGKQLKSIHAQTDIIPTILEILTGEKRQNSLADAWRGDKEAADKSKRDWNYEDCHVLTQPYDGIRLAVIRDGKKYTYIFRDKIVEETNMETDILELEEPKIIREQIEPEQFKNEFYCQRYKQSLILQK